MNNMKIKSDLQIYTSPMCKTKEFFCKVYCIEATSSIKGIDDGTGTIDDWGTPIEG